MGDLPSWRSIPMSWRGGGATRSGRSDNESADVEQAHSRYAAKKLDSNVKVSEI